MRHSLEDIVTVDAETFYSTEFSLGKQQYNTSSYVRDDQFKEHCWSIKVGTKAAKVYTADDGIKLLQDLDWAKYALLAHNTSFDGFILSHWHGIVPHYYYDTLSMTRGLHNEVSRASLATVAEFYRIGAKSKTYLTPTKGLRDLSPVIMKALMDGCKLDVELCFEVFKKQVEIYPQHELDLIDMTIGMFCDPVLEVDIQMAKQALADEMIERRATILKSGASEEDLMSNPKFAKLLVAAGITPPTKMSNKTGLESFAFAQTDQEFKDLLDHEDKQVVILTQARLAAKSTQAETRAHRLIQAGEGGYKLPVGLNYYAAKTGRWGGTNKLNLQNLPRVNPYEPKPSDGLRRSIIAPKGHALVVTDSAQIEARINAWLCGQQDVVDLFAANQDVYKHMATQIYVGTTLDKITKDQRFIGKIACLSSDTLVLTPTEWKRIAAVKDTDLVWDGIEWVKHQGAIQRGQKITYSFKSVRATADHGILTEHGWRGWCEVRTNPSLFQSALRLANLPLSTGGPTLKQQDDHQGGNPQSDARADGKDESIEQILNSDAQLDATDVRKSLRALNAGGNIKAPYQTTGTARDFLIGCRRVLGAAIRQVMRCMSTMENAVYQCAQSGAQTVQHSLYTCKPSTAGTFQNWNSIEKTTTETTNPETSGSYPDQTTQKTNASYPIKNSLSVPCGESEMTYDLLSAGPRNRFTIWSDSGPIIAHNCLGLGYGMGAAKFQTTLSLGMMGPAVDLTLAESTRIVKLYRARNNKIAKAWKLLNEVLEKMAAGKSGTIFNGLIEYDPMTLWLPNGMGLHYPGLHKGEGGELRYKANDMWKKIYGGLLLENIVQALARIVVGEQMLGTQDELRKLKLKKNEVARVVLMTHDEIVSAIPARFADKFLAVQLDVMRVPPHNWGADIPLDADGGWAENYSK
ncbi:DNA polymerase [Methylotenera sp.]|uniref:DNA polymerase n=1 Tax=Methylotenera sp. TaxID=2051956 RepID=UPI0027341A70|nr:DNA polymerase [Methylotenera sp.]MDP3308287.1 DNA polymerase [Methylotenera sp.]